MNKRLLTRILRLFLEIQVLNKNQMAYQCLLKKNIGREKKYSNKNQ